MSAKKKKAVPEPIQAPSHTRAATLADVVVVDENEDDEPMCSICGEGDGDPMWRTRTGYEWDLCLDCQEEILAHLLVLALRRASG